MSSFKLPSAKPHHNATCAQCFHPCLSTFIQKLSWSSLMWPFGLDEVTCPPLSEFGSMILQIWKKKSSTYELYIVRLQPLPKWIYVLTVKYFYLWGSLQGFNLVWKNCPRIAPLSFLVNNVAMTSLQLEISPNNVWTPFLVLFAIKGTNTKNMNNYKFQTIQITKIHYPILWQFWNQNAMYIGQTPYYKLFVVTLSLRPW